MADTSKRLCGPTLLSGAAATVYTVPGSTIAQVIHVHVFNNDSVERTFTMSIGADAAGTRVYDAMPVAPKSPWSDDGLFVLTAGEVLQAFGSSANKLNLTVSGVEST